MFYLAQLYLGTKYGKINKVLQTDMSLVFVKKPPNYRNDGLTAEAAGGAGTAQVPKAQRI